VSVKPQEAATGADVQVQTFAVCRYFGLEHLPATDRACPVQFPCPRITRLQSCLMPSASTTRRTTAKLTARPWQSGHSKQIPSGARVRASRRRQRGQRYMGGSRTASGAWCEPAPRRSQQIPWNGVLFARHYQILEQDPYRARERYRRSGG